MICGALASAATSLTYTVGGVASTADVAATPAATCRRKRNFYPDDVFIGVPSDDAGVQFYRLKPAEILKYVTSVCPAKFCW